MAGKHFVLVVNPRGGVRRGLAVLEAVRPIFRTTRAELDVRVTGGPGDAARIAQTMDLTGCDGICLIGGDGTIHEVAGGLLRRDPRAAIPLGIIPGGTGNSLLAHLQCSEPQEAARRIVAGRTRPLDVVRATSETGVAYCVNIVGWGAAVDINRTAERLRSLGPPRYAAAAAWHILRGRRRRARIILDGRTFEDDFLFAIACNTKFTGKGMQLAPRAEIDDGKVDMILVRPASRLQTVRLFQRVFDGAHLSLPFVECCQVRSFGIEPESGDLLNFDGELTGVAPVRGEVMPGALQVFV